MSRKKIAEDFLLLAASGNPREAFQKYAAPGFRHHNAYFKGDAQSLMMAMEEASVKNPNKLFQVQRSLEDGDHVAVHSRVEQENGTRIAVVHIFLFKDDKIIELWDIGQIEPAEPVNENGMF